MLQTTLYWVFFGLAAAGFVVAGVMVLFRTWTTLILERVGELPPKIIIEIIQTGSALTGVFAAFAPPADKGTWLIPVIAGGVCLLVGRILLLIVDSRQKAEAGRAKATAETLTRLLVGVRDAVKQKFARVLDAVRKDIKKPTINHVRDTLTPQPHLDDLLWRMALTLQGPLKPGAPDPNVRVGVYICRGGKMIPLHGVSLKNPGYNPFKSYDQHARHYQLPANEQSSHVVRCASQKRTIIVEDCERASRTNDFFYTHDDQKNYLRSMVVYHLGEVVDTDGKLADAVIAVDSDVSEFFKASMADVLDRVMQEFGLRVRLEMALQAFLKE